MPLYNSLTIPTALWQFDETTIVNAEQLGTGNKSQQVAFGENALGQIGPVSVTFSYASTPGSVQYDIQVANDDAEANYITIGSTTNVNGDRVDINTLAGGLKFRFLRVKETISPGVNATVKVLG